MKYRVLLFIGSACLLLLSLNVHAAARCVNSSGAVVGYADTAASCPAGSRLQGEVAAMPPAAASDVKSAQTQAAKDQQAVAQLEKDRIAQARVAAKTQNASQKPKGDPSKSCKTAQLALKRAQERYDNAPVSAPVKQPKATRNDTTQTHTVVRDSDSKTSKARKKAQHALEKAQLKHDNACA